MDPETCDEITRQMLLNSVDAWWAQFRISAESISTGQKGLGLLLLFEVQVLLAQVNGDLCPKMDLG